MQQVLIHQEGDLASLKLQTDKLDIGKLETTSVGFKKLSYVVDKEVI